MITAGLAQQRIIGVLREFQHVFREMPHVLFRVLLVAWRGTELPPPKLASG